MVASIIKPSRSSGSSSESLKLAERMKPPYDTHDNEDDETNTIIWWCNLLLHFPAKLYHRKNYVNCDSGKFQTVFPH